jgi:hypothetical protein
VPGSAPGAGGSSNGGGDRAYAPARTGGTGGDDDMDEGEIPF